MSILERFLPAVGEVVTERYELREEIGRGGFGVVYRATQIGLNEDVAVKILLPHVLDNEDVAQRFEREVTVAKGLRHPNTIRILDYATTDKGLPFYVMEYIRGKSLEDHLAESGPLSPSRTRRIIEQVLKSLAEAHAKGVIHRDLKPANLILTEIFGEEDFVKVLDFGIAKALTGEAALRQTSTGMVLGTPTYMSPEQALGRKDLDGRSDLYAVGLIIAECLSAEPVVTGDTPYLVVAEHASPDPLRFIPELAATELFPVVLKATAKDPNRRYLDATEMRLALEELGPLPDEVSVALSGPHGPRRPPPSLPVITPTTPSGMQVFAAAQGEVDPSARTMAGATGETRLGGRGGTGRALLIVVLLALVAGAGVLAITRAGSSPRSEDPGPIPDVTPSSPSVTPGAGEPGAELTGPPSPSTPSLSSDEIERRAANRAALAVAEERVSASLPAVRPVRFEGSEITVSFGGQPVGQTPIELRLPRVNARLEFGFEREGYRSVTRDISLLEDRIDVELERRGRDRDRGQEDRTPPTVPEPPTREPEPEPEPEPPTISTPFGQTPIRD